MTQNYEKPKDIVFLRFYISGMSFSFDGMSKSIDGKPFSPEGKSKYLYGKPFSLDGNPNFIYGKRKSINILLLFIDTKR